MGSIGSSQLSQLPDLNSGPKLESLYSSKTEKYDPIPAFK